MSIANYPTNLLRFRFTMTIVMCAVSIHKADSRLTRRANRHLAPHPCFNFSNRKRMSGSQKPPEYYLKRQPQEDE